MQFSRIDKTNVINFEVEINFLATVWIRVG